jgi:hypothetical protein
MITIHDVAIARGIKVDTDGSISFDAYTEVGLPMMGGCCSCAATIAAYNSYPGKNGYIHCLDCIEGTGFDTVAEFEAFVLAEIERDLVNDVPVVQSCGCGHPTNHRD